MHTNLAIILKPGVAFVLAIMMTRKTLTLLPLIVIGCSSQAGIRTKLSHAMVANQILEHQTSHGEEARLNDECDELPVLVIEVPGVAFVSEAKLAQLFSERHDPRTTDAETVRVSIVLEGYSGGWFPSDTAGLIAGGIVDLFGPHPKQKTGITIWLYQWHCPKVPPPVSEPVIEEPRGL